MDESTGSDAERPPPGAGDRGRSSWLNALIGAVVTTVTAFVPFSPVLGGAVAGYLEAGGDRSGLRVGALAGVLAAVPLLAVFGLVFLVLFFGIAVVGEVAAPLLVVGVLAVIALFAVVYVVGLSAFGGFVGAAIAERERR